MTGFPAIQDGTITVSLSRHEAIVLLEWLGAHGENLPTGDRAEQIVLWRVEAQLEKALVEQFSSNYGSLLSDARAKVREAAIEEPSD